VGARASACVLCIALALPADGFYYTFHEMLINEAFVQIKRRNLPNAGRLDEIIDRHAAIEASTQLDDDENGAPDQYKHSMRPNGVSLSTAKARSSRDIDDQRSDAIHAAVRGDRVTAGRLIGRILHAVQDRKHLWCSCGAGSNPPQSAPFVSCPEGNGNHGLPDNCEESLRGLGPTSLRSFQLRTDFDPEEDQLRAAVRSSVEELERFLTGYTSAPRTP
jgi:hypothetical protein